MAGFSDWLLQRSAQGAEKRARKAFQQATVAFQQAQTTRSPQAIAVASVATSKAIAASDAAANAMQRLFARAQQQAQGRLPVESSAGIERQRQALAVLAKHLSPGADASHLMLPAPDAASASGSQAIATDPLHLAGMALHSVEYALADLTKQQQALQAAQLADQQRQQYLAQYGGIDPEAVMAQIKSGQYPAIPAGVLLHKNELALCALPARLAEDRTTSRRVGGYSGASVPVGFGVRFRVGSYQGRTISQERLTTVDQGVVVVTTQRILFTGAKRNATLQVAKVVNTTIYKDGVDVRADNRVKREVFLCDKPRLLNTYILIACQLAG